MADMITRFLGSSRNDQYIASQMYQGVTDPRVLDVTSEVSIIDLLGAGHRTAWVSASFVNDGPNSVFVAINIPTELFEVKSGETASVNRIGALTRIETIYLHCAAGHAAAVRVTGEY